MPKTDTTSRRLQQIKRDIAWFSKEEKSACCSHKAEHCEEEIYFLKKERSHIKRKQRATV